MGCFEFGKKIREALQSDLSLEKLKHLIQESASEFMDHFAKIQVVPWEKR